ncbi:MAG: nucleotidyltransferase domain-containing protein [Coriobacteriia bacterium]|nr:nucleotidyltransferase domain-containing protein [Coriobacteriia bacterium]
MRRGKAVTVYLSDRASEALDRVVEERARADRESGLTGYSVTNRSKLVSSIVEEYLLEWEDGDLTITRISSVISPILKRYGVKRAELYGSYARGEQNEESDVDLLIDEGDALGLKFFRLQNELSEALGKKVDLQSLNGRNQDFLEKTMVDRVVVYAA